VIRSRIEIRKRLLLDVATILNNDDMMMPGGLSDDEAQVWIEERDELTAEIRHRAESLGR
jgi:hypothetical protein